MLFGGIVWQISAVVAGGLALAEENAQFVQALFTPCPWSVIKLDVTLAERKVKSKDLAEYVGITEANLSLLKQGKVKGVRFDTLQRIRDYLQCQPGDLLVSVPAAAD